MKKLICKLLFASLATNFAACSKETKREVVTNDDQKMEELNKRIIELEKQLEKQKLPITQPAPHFENQNIEINRLNNELQSLREKLESEQSANATRITETKNEIEAQKYTLQAEIQRLKKLYESKLRAKTLPQLNAQILNAFDGHRALNNFVGKYKVLVIPVEFSDIKLDARDFYVGSPAEESAAQKYLFGPDENSLTSYYKHASLGQFQLSGKITNPVTVSGKLQDYGGNIDTFDKNPGGLVIEALAKLRDNPEARINWQEYDNWDIYDYDNDKNYHEPDGFVDSIILVYAGKSESTCGRYLNEVMPEDPRYEMAQNCLNQIWPHRSRIWMNNKNHVEYREKGPIVEGTQRPSLSGIELSKNVFASDYNMQSEYSDRSTFTHEFGHSLGLPDVYAKETENNVNEWELMAQNAEQDGQELSTYSKLLLGWIRPKIIKQGEDTTAYLGSYNFVSTDMRENRPLFEGPLYHEETNQSFDILSIVPEFDEPVYRSLIVLPEPTQVSKKIINVPASFGDYTSYSQQFNNEHRFMSITLRIPNEEKVLLNLDVIYGIETDTNFESRGQEDKEIRVIKDYDSGYISVNDQVLEHLQLYSGDDNKDSLVENNPACDAKQVLAKRLDFIENPTSITLDEISLFNELLAPCRVPVAKTLTYDLSQYRGQKIELKIGLKADQASSELGILVDNIKLNNRLIEDFENADQSSVGQFTFVEQGEYVTKSHQFYLMEYRTPGTNFGAQSYNKDNNMGRPLWSYFVDQPIDQLSNVNNKKSMSDRIRLVKQHVQPGVLVWYFNGRYEANSSGNDAGKNDGEGFLLLVNPRQEDLKMPRLYDKDELRGSNGFFDRNSDLFITLYDSQNKEYECFAGKKIFEMRDGYERDCSAFADNDQLSNYTFAGKRLHAYGEPVNNILPQDRKKHLEVNYTFQNRLPYRSQYATFTPEGAEDFAASTVYKIDQSSNSFVVDEDETNAIKKYKALSNFDDSIVPTIGHPRFGTETAVVIPKGLKFKVVKPSQRILDLYQDSLNGEQNNNKHRAPQAKILIEWKK